MNIEIIIDSPDWNSRKVRKLIKDATKAVFSYLKLQNDDVEISVLCTNDEEIRVLNRTYRGIDSSTNVLSFPMESDTEYDDFDYSGFNFGKESLADLNIEDLENKKKYHCDECSDSECYCCGSPSENNCVLGCTAFAYETIDRESKEQGKIFDDHMKHLVVHSVLHLLGYDHVENRDAKKMEDLEIKILQTLGINNPYQEKE